MNLAGYIKLHRKMMNWRWKDHPPTLCLFIHLLLAASYETERTSGGLVLAPGQAIVSTRSLAKETGLTRDQIRTALSHLQQTGEIIFETAPGCRNSIITIQNWNKYQLSPSESPSCSPSSETPETQTGQGFSMGDLAPVPPVNPPVDPQVTTSPSFSPSKSPSESPSCSPSSETPEAKQDKDSQPLSLDEAPSKSPSFSPSKSPSKSPTIYKELKRNSKNIKKNTYGEGGFVLLTEQEHEKLTVKYGEAFLAKCIEKLDNYIGSKGGKDSYKSHYYVINGWVKDDIAQRYPGLMKPQKTKQTTTTTPQEEEEDPLAAWGGSL